MREDGAGMREEEGGRGRREREGLITHRCKHSTHLQYM